MRKNRKGIARKGSFRTVVNTGQKNEPTLEGQWGVGTVGEGGIERSRRQGLSLLVSLGGLCIVSLAVWGVFLSASGGRDRSAELAPAGQAEEMEARLLRAEEVARAFVSETDVAKRLGYARNPVATKAHLPRYPEQARNHPVRGIKLLGHSELNGRAVSAYAAEFDDGSFRMLSVVQTDEGPKVDWDCYARYCSASWNELISGKVKQAEVRVFVRPGNVHRGAFQDREKWTCFKLETPDSTHRIFAYTPVDSEMGKRMRSAVMKSRDFRQHMTLGITRVEGNGNEGIFVVDELLAMGWVLGRIE